MVTVANLRDLKEYISNDMRANGYHRSNKLYRYINYKLHLLMGFESAAVCKYLRVLRRYEYYLNQNSNLIIKIIRRYYNIRYNKLSLKYHIKIWPNCVESGLYVAHITGGVIINALHMGKNCIVNSGVVIGNKSSQENRATIGENVYCSLGSKIIGKVVIGDGSIIAPNAVVTKNVPPKSIVGGVPARVIKSI